MEKIIAKWKRSTGNKMMWAAVLGTVEFKFYIPKWRIPQPAPEEILIKIYFPSEEVSDKKSISKTDTQLHPELKKNKIYTDVHRDSIHSQTVRFDPKGNSNNWEIGSPYIPKSLLKDQDVSELSLVIEWLGLNDLEKSGDSNEIEEIKKLLSIGESDTIEFKSSLRYDYNAKNLNKELQFIVAKEISGFLNTDGGKLIIGVNDNGTLLGLDNDYNTLRKKNKDGFNLALVQVISNHIGEEFNDYWQVKFTEIDEKEICILEVKKSPEPVITHKKGKEENFYIRSGHATIPLNRRKMLKYISNHFKKQTLN